MAVDNIARGMAADAHNGGGGGGGLLVVHCVEGFLDKKAGELYAAAQTSPVLVDYEGSFCLLTSFSLESGPHYTFGFFQGSYYITFIAPDADAYPEDYS